MSLKVDALGMTVHSFLLCFLHSKIFSWIFLEMPSDPFISHRRKSVLQSIDCFIICLSYFVQYLVFWRNQHTLPYHFSFLFVKLGSEFFQNSDVGFKKQSILCATRTWVFLKHNLVILMLKVTQKFPFLRSWSADVCDGRSNLWAADPACLYSPDPSPPAHTMLRLPWPLEGADLGHLRESISVSSSPIPLALRHPPHPHSPPDPIFWLLKAGHQGLAQVAQSSFCARIFIALSVTVPFTFGT